MPKISVVMPAYNAEKYIAEAIGSILAQFFGDFEFIILNDCSKDTTESVILSFDDERIVYVKNEENLGVARTLNKGLAIARGEYIARMDADDMALPRRFESQAAYLDANPGVAVLGCAVELFDESGGLGSRVFSADPEQMRLDLFFACGLAHPGVMLRREVIAGLGGYDPEYEGLEDYELWCRVLEGHQVAALPEVLLRYRVHGAQVTKNPPQKYTERLLRLKKRQLAALGIPEQEARSYFDYCLGKRPEGLKEVQAWCGFLEGCVNANRESGVYDREKMERYFGSIATGAAAALPLKDALAVCRGCDLVSAPWLLAKRARKIR